MRGTCATLTRLYDDIYEYVEKPDYASKCTILIVCTKATAFYCQSSAVNFALKAEQRFFRIYNHHRRLPSILPSHLE